MKSSIFVLAFVIAATSVSAEERAAFASGTNLSEAASKACYLDAIRMKRPAGVESLIRNMEPNIKRMANLEANWISDFNKFNASPLAIILNDYAEVLNNSGAGRYSDFACKKLVPAFGLAFTATTIKYSSSAIQEGPLLQKCGEKWCIPPSLAAVQKACETDGLSSRYTEWCRDTPGWEQTQDIIQEKPINR